jgi:hypothetical protein
MIGTSTHIVLIIIIDTDITVVTTMVVEVTTMVGDITTMVDEVTTIVGEVTTMVGRVIPGTIVEIAPIGKKVKIEIGPQ